VEFGRGAPLPDVGTAGFADLGRAGVGAQQSRRRVGISRLPWTWLGTLAMHALVLAVYAWLATAGQFRSEDNGGYYDLLADAFQAGQLNLKNRPRP
jgi:hypothetical protein